MWRCESLLVTAGQLTDHTLPSAAGAEGWLVSRFTHTYAHTRAHTLCIRGLLTHLSESTKALVVTTVWTLFFGLVGSACLIVQLLGRQRVTQHPPPHPTHSRASVCLLSFHMKWCGGSWSADYWYHNQLISDFSFWRLSAEQASAGTLSMTCWPPGREGLPIRNDNRPWSSAPGSPRVCVCVEVIKKTSGICLFRAGGQQTQVGLLSDWNVFVPKGHLQFPDEGFLNCGIGVRFNGQENVLRTRIIRDNTAPCWAKENIHMNVEILFQYFFLFFIFYFCQEGLPWFVSVCGRDTQWPINITFHVPSLFIFS